MAKITKVPNFFDLEQQSISNKKAEWKYAKSPKYLHVNPIVAV
jgi:hypothetical protein